MKLPRHRKADTVTTTDREIMLGSHENFNWPPGFGKHRATTEGN